MTNIKEEIKALKNLRDQIDRIIKKYYIEQLNQQIEDNKQYIGKCYIDARNKRYVKIVSQYGYSPNTVTGLCVKMGAILKYNIDNEGLRFIDPIVSLKEEFVYFDSILIEQELSEMQEISPEEFTNEMDDIYKQFKIEVNSGARTIDEIAQNL